MALAATSETATLTQEEEEKELNFPFEAFSAQCTEMYNLT